MSSAKWRQFCLGLNVLMLFTAAMEGEKECYVCITVQERICNVNSLVHGICECNYGLVFFNSCEGYVTCACSVKLSWMPRLITDDESSLIQVMAWCLRQQIITWTNVDQVLWWHMASLCHNRLTLVKLNICDEAQNYIHISIILRLQVAKIILYGKLDSTRRKASEICLRPPLDIYSHTFSR